MAHNLHLIVVRAESGLDACNEAEDLLFDFGTENNWRSMCGAVSEDNEVYLNGEGRYEPDEKSDTIEKINEMVQKAIGTSWKADVALQALKEGRTIETMTANELWSYAKYIEDLMEKRKFEEGRAIEGKPIDATFDVLTESYNEYDYTEFGVTNVAEQYEGKKWVVLMDMHD